MRFILTLSLLIISLLHHAQVMPATTQAAWPELIAFAKKTDQLKEQEMKGWPIYKIRNTWHLSLMGKIGAHPQWSALTSMGIIKGTVIGDIATIKVPLHLFNGSIPFDQVFTYLELPGMIQPHLDKVRYDTRIDSVHQGILLPQQYTGENVLIGITDWGFDYTHPMFYDTLLQETRILSAWDQFKQAGNGPMGYDYGAEYNSAGELLAANCDTVNIYGYATHGSHVAGIAGGSGAGTNLRGMAPAAQFLFATFLIDAASVIDAFYWMSEKANEEDKRLVINMSWGLYHMGTLDGTSLLSQVIDELSDSGVVFVTSAGNNGSDGFHIKKTFNNDEMTTRVRFDSYTNPNMWGQSITMWGEPNKSFEAKIGVFSNGNALLTEAPFYATATADAYTIDTLVTSNNDSIFYNVTVDALHPLNNRPHMRLRVKCTNTNLRIGLTARAEEGTVHFWNVVELKTDVGNWGMPFNGYGTSPSAGDSNYSISEPACAHSAIAVAAYSAEYLVNGIPNGGQIASFTSIGPLITEEMKPDIAAPGVSVASSISYFTDNSYGTFATFEFNDRIYPYAKFSGTSMSSPCVAGIVALMLEANPELTPDEIKSILQNTARLDSHTGSIEAPGHVRWGYGKINGYKAVKNVAPTVGVKNIYHHIRQLNLYPNPTADRFRLNIDNETILQVRAIDMLGKAIVLPHHQNDVTCSELAGGLYRIEVITSGNVYQAGLVKQ
jgi:minor extracellular serine protease Vpr